MEGVITEEDVKYYCENLVDMMTRGNVDSITIEDINRGIFYITEHFRPSPTSKLEAIFDAAAERGEGAERKLQEGKSILNKSGLIPGFIVFDKRSIEILLNGINLESECYNTCWGSALHFALENKNEALAEYLIERGYSLYRENSDGLTPLDTVCKYDLDLTILLKANIDINHVNSKGFKSLHYALEYHNKEIAKELVKLGGDKDEKYRLLEAVEADNLKMINFANRVEVTKNNFKYCDNMIVMMSRGDFDSITIEDINQVLFYIVHSIFPSTRKLEEIFDAAAERSESAKKKLQEGKSIQTKIRGVIPGFFACDKKSIEILLNGINLESERYNTCWGSALHFALETKNNPLVEYLIKHGYPLYKENSDGLTPLDTACKYNLDLTIFFEASVDINHVNSKGFKSLHYALEYHNTKIVKELIKLGGDRYEKDNRLLEAVEAGNLKMIKHDLHDHEFHPIEGMTDYLMELAIARRSTPIMEILIEKGYQIKKLSLLKLAIVEKQLSSLLLLLHNKKEIDIDLNSLYPFDVLSEKEALITLPSLLEYCGTLELNIINEFIEKLININYHRCMKVFLKYLSKSRKESDIMTNSLLSKSRGRRDPGSNLLELAARSSEDTFLVLIDFIDINHINRGDIWNRQIYHILLDEKKYKCLKKMFDKTVFEEMKVQNLRFLNLDVSFLNSIEKTRDHEYPKDHDDSISPTLLHKLKDCQDSKVKFHPVVNTVVEAKLAKYRWWYVLTFVLYCIFLSSLYFALLNASYQCDNALFSYTGSFGALRAVCEVVILIYGILFSVDESIEFSIIFIRFSSTNFKTKNLLNALLKKDEGKLKNWRIFRENLPSLIKIYFGIFNLIDILGLVFLFLLIIFRISTNPFQWTLASFTIIFFTLRLFKYTRNNPSLGAYVKSIFQIFKRDIIQFSVIVLIIILAYFGGIHLAARQTYVSPSDSTTIVPPDNCSNNSFTGLFWFDQERTSSYDLRRPLLSGIIFLLDGGPGNEETELLDSNFLFSFLYLGFAFTLVVVMSNILIAQLSQTYAEVTKNAFLPFKFDLVVSVEYESNLAFFFGGYLRKDSLSWVRLNPENWKDFFEVDLQAEILEKLEDNSNVLNDRMEKNQKDTKVALEFQKDTFSNDIFGVKENIRSVKEDTGGVKEAISSVKEDISSVKEDISGVQGEIGDMKQDIKKEIGNMKQDVRKEIGGVKESMGEMKLDLENRMEHMEGMMNKVLNLLEQSTPTSATL